MKINPPGSKDKVSYQVWLARSLMLKRAWDWALSGLGEPKLRSRNHNPLELQVKYHEDFEKSKGSFTPVVTDPITERVKKNMQDFSDISYRGIQRRVVEMERKRVDQDQENLTGQESRAHLSHEGVPLSSATSTPIHHHLLMFSSKSFLKMFSPNSCRCRLIVKKPNLCCRIKH